VLLALGVLELVSLIKDDCMGVKLCQGGSIDPQCVIACQDDLGMNGAHDTH
jgi:hypothetical protein